MTKSTTPNRRRQSQEWEYRTAVIENDGGEIGDKLTNIGAAGCELVAVVRLDPTPNHEWMQFFFKRPR